MLTYNTIVEQLVSEVSDLKPIYEEHIKDYEEVLPHVFFWDLTKFITDLVEKDPESASLKTTLNLLEESINSQDAKLKDLIYASFLENLDPQAAGFKKVRSLLGPMLSQKYAEFYETNTTGDIFEVETSKGRAYLHCIDRDKNTIEIIRALPGLFSQRLNEEELENLVQQKELYIFYFPLSVAYKQKMVEKVGHFSSASFESPKYMRSADIVRNELWGWHIVDTDTLKRKSVQELTEEEKDMSTWGIWGMPILEERLAAEWTPRKDVEKILKNFPRKAHKI